MGEYRGKYRGNPNLHRGRRRLNRALDQGSADIARFHRPWTSGCSRADEKLPTSGCVSHVVSWRSRRVEKISGYAVWASIGRAALDDWRRFSFEATDRLALRFAVREPFPSVSSQATLVFGTTDQTHPLALRSMMPENGVIFSDGMEADFLNFTSGLIANITVAERVGHLVQ
jgi:hypothetical protein